MRSAWDLVWIRIQFITNNESNPQKLWNGGTSSSNTVREDKLKRFKQEQKCNIVRCYVLIRVAVMPLAVIIFYVCVCVCNCDGLLSLRIVGIIRMCSKFNRMQNCGRKCWSASFSVSLFQHVFVASSVCCRYCLYSVDVVVIMIFSLWIFLLNKHDLNIRKTEDEMTWAHVMTYQQMHVSVQAENLCRFYSNIRVNEEKRWTWTERKIK